MRRHGSVVDRWWWWWHILINDTWKNLIPREKSW
jgi:hypothetical protein